MTFVVSSPTLPIMPKKTALPNPADETPNEPVKLTLEDSKRLADALVPIDPGFIGMAPDAATAELLTIGKLHLQSLLAIIADKDKALAKAELDLGDFALALQEYSNETGGQLVFQNFQLCLDMIRNRRKG